MMLNRVPRVVSRIAVFCAPTDSTKSTAEKIATVLAISRLLLQNLIKCLKILSCFFTLS